MLVAQLQNDCTETNNVKIMDYKDLVTVWSKALTVGSYNLRENDKMFLKDHNGKV